MDDVVVLQVPLGVPDAGGVAHARTITLAASSVDWARTDAPVDAQLARRAPTGGGADFDDPAARVHMLLLRHPSQERLRPAQIWQALAGQGGGLAAWCQPGYTALWVAADKALGEAELTTPLLPLLPGSSRAAFHLAQPAPPIDEPKGVPKISDASWHFHL